MNRIKPQEFWDSFAEELRDAILASGRWPEIYMRGSEWTPFITSVCNRVGHALEFHDDSELCAEYMKIDYGFFRNQEPDKHRAQWDWEVAIEIEGNERTPWDWLEELTRLTHLNAGLKVLITYVEFRNDGCNEALKRARSIYGGRRYRQSDDRWLFIFGPSSSEIHLPGADFRGFAWDGQGDFLPLTQDKILPGA